MIKIKAPSITSLAVDILAANFIYLKWDDAGTNFYYFIEVYDGESWNVVDRTKNNFIFYDGLNPNTEYKFRISVNGEGFETSDWVYSEEILTFEKNLYNLTKMRQLQLSKSFIENRLVNNNYNYINFNRDTLYASLMDSRFNFSDIYYDYNQIEQYILKDKDFHEIQGSIEPVCVNKERVMIAQLDDVLYAFERYQPVVKVSNDKGQNWHYYIAFNDRVGNPVSKTIAYQNNTTTFILGYSKLFYGRKSNDVRFSSDTVRFSDNEVTFAKLGDDNKLPFDVEIFGEFASLTGDVSKYAEAFTANNKFVYVASRNIVRFISLDNYEIEDDPSSPIFGERKFEETILNITDSNKVVVKKMDSVNDEIFALITGEVKEYGLDPTNPKNVIDSRYKGVYKLVNDKFVRIFGNNTKERSLICHEYSNMSTNGKKLFLGSANFNFNDFISDVDIGEGSVGNLKFDVKTRLDYKEDFIKNEINVNADTLASYSKNYLHRGKTTRKSIHYSMFSTTIESNFEEWIVDNQEYYNEFNFSYFHRDKTRTWINNDYKAVVVYPEIVYTKIIDEYGPTSPQRTMKEVWNNGVGKYITPNIEFSDFNQYAGGILIHKNSGEIFGYYEFDYRVRDYVKLHWKPNLISLVATLTHQTRKAKYIEEKEYGLQDPDLSPLIHTMNPESYVGDDNFSKFIEYYLQFISKGNNTSYNKLLNLIRNKYQREENAYEFLWSELYKRNIYLDKSKRDAVIRFFETRKSDFYSAKGTEASYKFLFKLLYNEDVEIDIESKNGLEYDIIVESNTITEDIVGTTIYTETGKSNVTYLEREYNNGKLQWRVTIHNLLGRFIEGQVVKSETVDFDGLIRVGVRGKDMMTNTIDYINRGKSSYIMRIKSSIPSTRYRDDLIRFVHPVGFGFIGVTLLTIFLNSGLNMKHTETIIRNLRNYKFDAGYPTVYPDRVLKFNNNGDADRDPITGEVMYLEHPRNGETFVVPPEYDKEEDLFNGMLPSDIRRRSSTSPLFDASGTSYAMYREMVDLYLKDNIGNPRDPENPTQEKVNDD